MAFSSLVSLISNDILNLCIVINYLCIQAWFSLVHKTKKATQALLSCLIYCNNVPYIVGLLDSSSSNNAGTVIHVKMALSNYTSKLLSVVSSRRGDLGVVVQKRLDVLDGLFRSPKNSFALSSREEEEKSSASGL